MVMAGFADAHVIQLEKSTHILLEPGILLMEVKEGVFFELDDAEIAHEAHLKLGSGKPFCILLDTKDGFFNVSPEAKKRIASAEFAQYMLASAFVVTSMPARLAGNFFVRLVKPAAPTRLFSNRSDALRWLKTFAK